MTVGKRIVALGAALLLGACIPSAQSAEFAERAAPPPLPVAPALTRPAPARAAPTPPPAPSVAPAVLAAQRALDERIRTLGSGFDGDVGIAVKDIQTGWTSHWLGTRLFPQQSVSKFWVALTAMDRADKGALNMHRTVTVKREDLTLFNQPIRQQVLNGGFTTTLDDLMYRALTQSDNTANDFVMWQAGGPEAVREFLAAKKIDGVRFGPGERLLQTHIAGMEWRPSYSIGNNFYTARSSVSADRRRSSFEEYIADPIDGATPIGLVDGLARLHKGELLSPASTQRILSAMSNTRTGPQRLKGGLAPGWKLAHKTGTGQVLGGTQAGYNDIGILTAPDGRAYAVAVMIGRTSRPLPERMRLMQNTTRAVIAYTEAMGRD